jgi:hypothetical protein
MYVVTMESGTTFAMPDVCKTQIGPAVVPIPYPNVAEMMMGDPPADTVLIGGVPPLTKMSKIPISEGDDTGEDGGIISETFIQEVQFETCSLTVTFQGKPAVCLMDAITANKMNAEGMVDSPSQVLVSAN